MATSITKQVYTQDTRAKHPQVEEEVGVRHNWFRHPAQPDFGKNFSERLGAQRRSERYLQTPLNSARPIAHHIISSRIAEAIKASRRILDLKDDWDEEGSSGYEESTWKRAKDFVVKVTTSFHQSRGFWVDPPRILPGPQGSIDIHWKTSMRELLINIPESKEEPADYYGCGSLQDAIKGKLDTQLPNEWILLWLTR